MTIVPDTYANEFKMFDEYKVHSLTVKYIPWSNSSNWVSAGVSLDPSAYWTMDQDDGALITSFSKALNADNVRIVSLLESQGAIHTSYMPQSDPETRLKWGNVQAPSPSAPDATTPLKLGAVKVYTGAYEAANVIRGLFVATWDIEYQGLYTNQ